MQYTHLGNTGLEVSPIALGCMSYGDSARGAHGWTLSEEDSRPFIQRAVELGVNFFDTANTYSDGMSEEIVGRALRDFAVRDQVVIATKVFGDVGTGPNQHGLSRKAVLQEVDNSLRRLGTDYVDLLIIHRFDHRTPVRETLRTLDDVVRSGKVRYIGASSMYAWEFATTLGIQRAEGWAEFVSMQSQYNLLAREDERELIPLCSSQGIGITPWSPLARGRLTRDWEARAARMDSDAIVGKLYRGHDESNRAITEAVATIADSRGASRAQVALAWLMAQPGVTAPIVGATKPHHLTDAVSALEIELTAAELDSLSAPYTPRLPEPF
ncbi:aldo/keto reductase [Microbacterium sp. GXF0217]